jgi:hypothetical protein
MGLLWYRRKAVPLALVTSVVFLQTTLYSHPVIARAEAITESVALQKEAAPRQEEPPASATPAPARGTDVTVDSTRDRLSSAAAEPTQANGAVPSGALSIEGPAGTQTGGGGISPQAASLPTGAATQLGMGESFSAQLSTGTAGYSVPLILPSARGRAQPKLSLQYSSGAGFGVAGVGWSIGTPAVARQTDRGSPGYADQGTWQPNQDRFAFAGMELVPICTVSSGACAGSLAGEAMPSWSNGWQYFRPRVEGAFLRFFWSADHQTWRVQSKDGTELELGVPLDGSGYEGALERNPSATSQIFTWRLVRQYDGQVDSSGNPVNTVVYRYAADGGTVYLSDEFDTPPASA